jgi:peroxiredoxin
MDSQDVAWIMPAPPTAMARIGKLVCVGLLALGAARNIIAAPPPASSPTNQPGWTWQLRPIPLSLGQTNVDGLLLRVEQPEGRGLAVTVSRANSPTNRHLRLRPVAFDENGRRFEFALESVSSQAGTILEAHALDLNVLPRERARWIGVERLTPEGWRDVVAPAAFRALQAASVQALPFPRIGEVYDFRLTSLSGEEVRASALRGQVVLLDFWARWCVPCVTNLPQLKELYRQWHSRGLEIIGLNHDPTPAMARRSVAEHQLPWPNVLAPVDARRRQLWLDASGTESLPRLLLIDRNGVVRGDLTPETLAAEVQRRIEDNR